jgi:hypothetical protein
MQSVKLTVEAVFPFKPLAQFPMLLRTRLLQKRQTLKITMTASTVVTTSSCDARGLALRLYIEQRETSS